MKSYLSSTQVADELGVSRDALNAEIRAGTFIPADVVVGNRFQGWSRGTVDMVRQDREGNTIRCDSAGVQAVIVDVRRAAEVVRAYAYSPDKAERQVYVEIPRALMILAARLDAEMRRIIMLDHTMARRISDIGTTTARYANEDCLDFEASAVAGVLTPVNVNDEMRAWRLREAAAAIAQAVLLLPEHLKSTEARRIARDLGMLRDAISEYADNEISA